jgi:hypothetical protein
VLEEHFASEGAQLGLRKHSPDVLGMDYAIGWRPVEVEGLPEEVQAIARASFEVRADGHLYRGDCVLAIRSFAARDEQRQMTEELRASQEDDARWVEGIEEQLQGLAASTGRASGRQLLVGNVPHLTDHVLGGSKLAPLVERELRGATGPRRGRPHRNA